MTIALSNSHPRTEVSHFNSIPNWKKFFIEYLCTVANWFWSECGERWISRDGQAASQGGPRRAKPDRQAAAPPQQVFSPLRPRPPPPPSPALPGPAPRLLPGRKRGRGLGGSRASILSWFLIGLQNLVMKAERCLEFSLTKAACQESC